MRERRDANGEVIEPHECDTHYHFDDYHSHIHPTTLNGQMSGRSTDEPMEMDEAQTWLVCLDVADPSDEESDEVIIGIILDPEHAHRIGYLLATYGLIDDDGIVGLNE